ncbi:hypothetical protein LguiA_011650 [Lonicera macranthoides]
MAPDPRAMNAFRAMRDIGIPEEKTKPILKILLKLYEKKWEYIEEENYRVLADAIFDAEEIEGAEIEQQHENTQPGEDLVEEAPVEEETERPLKRLRLRHQEGQASPSLSNSRTGTSLKRPIGEHDELPETCTVTLMPNSEITRAELRPISPHPVSKSKGKQIDVTVRSVSNSSPRNLRGREKEPPAPQNDPRKKKRISDGSSNAVVLKEPKVDAGLNLFPKQKVPDRALIKPKDEPFTEEMPQLELPITVIHPERLPNGNSSIGNGSLEEPESPEPIGSQSIGGLHKSDDIPASSSEERPSSELAIVPNVSTTILGIASSPLGEVKVSLSCNSAPGKPNFSLPSLDTVLKVVEDKCLRSYKVNDLNFSMTKLMKDMCACILELGTDSNNDLQAAINVSQTLGLSKKCCAADAPSANHTPSSPSNGMVYTEVSLPCNGVDACTQSDRNISQNDREIDNVMEHNGFDHTDSRSLVDVEQCLVTLDDTRCPHDFSDIAKGQERIKIPLVNEINSESPPSFHYIPQNVVLEKAYLNFSMARIGDDNCCSACFGDCLLSSTPCACLHETGGEFAYTSEGLVKEKFLDECISMNRDPEKHCHCYCEECPLERSKNEGILEPCKGHLVRRFIKECWWKCGCSKLCGNRVVQRGINRKLQVFMTSGVKGWGLRTLEDLPKGAFVCEYVGEVLTNAELYDRVSRRPKNEEHAYPVLLDADWGSEEFLKDEEALCLDATYYGNVARFINHRCFDSNLVEIPVEVETPDHHYYHLAFFTARKVAALEELTWDYGIDFDDRDHPVKAFRCRCGSKFCRNRKRSRRRSSARK